MYHATLCAYKTEEFVEFFKLVSGKVFVCDQEQPEDPPCSSLYAQDNQESRYAMPLSEESRKGKEEEEDATLPARPQSVSRLYLLASS